MGVFLLFVHLPFKTYEKSLRYFEIQQFSVKSLSNCLQILHRISKSVLYVHSYFTLHYPYGGACFLVGIFNVDSSEDKARTL